jgi:hypothetical protein
MDNFFRKAARPESKLTGVSAPRDFPSVKQRPSLISFFPQTLSVSYRFAAGAF